MKKTFMRVLAWAAMIFGGLIVIVGFSGHKGKETETITMVLVFVGIMLIVGGWRLYKQNKKIGKKPTYSLESFQTSSARGYSTKNCPECDERLPLDAVTCEFCGKKQKLGDSTCSGGVDTAAAGRSSFAGERGSTHYIWRSVHDGARCERCANNDGRKFSWDKEPPGGHAGAAARCRCYPEAIIPRD